MGSENDIKFLDISKKVEELVESKNIEDAKKIIKPAIAFIESIDNKNEDSTNYTFDSAIEFVAYTVFFNKDKSNAKWIRQIYSRLYTQYGYILIEENELDLAFEMLNESLKWNPMAIGSYYEIASIYQRKNDLDKYLEYTLKAGKKCLTFRGLAKYFRNLGFYYIEKEEYKLAICLYAISLVYEKNNYAYSEIDYIKEKLKDNFSIPTYKECFDFAKEKQIDILPNIKVLSNLYAFADGQKLSSTSNFKLIKDIYQLIYDFVLDEEIKDKIKKIDDLMNNKGNINELQENQNNEENREEISNDIEIALEEKTEENLENVIIKEEKSVEQASQELINKLNISNSLIVSSALEIIKLVLNILIIRKQKDSVKIFDFKKTLNVLMMNTYKSFISQYNDLNNEIIQLLEKYYEMDENVQTEVIGAILFGLRKTKDEDNIF